MTKGLASDAGELKAQTAARLALTSIALWWETPSSTLDGFNLLIDRNIRQQRSLGFVPGRRITLWAMRVQGRLHGPPVSPAIWARILADERNVFEAAGELIEFYLSPTGKVSRPNLMNSLAQALLWFHEGCREQVDLMAIIKFSAVLDALSSGDKAGGIKKLIKARLGTDPNDPIRSNGQTVKQAIAEIYIKGRSDTIHGTNKNFTHDWTSARRLSEEISRYCLLSCLDWSGSNNDDNPQLLMQ